MSFSNLSFSVIPPIFSMICVAGCSLFGGISITLFAPCAQSSPKSAIPLWIFVHDAVHLGHLVNPSTLRRHSGCPRSLSGRKIQGWRVSGIPESVVIRFHARMISDGVWRLHRPAPFGIYQHVHSLSTTSKSAILALPTTRVACASADVASVNWAVASLTRPSWFSRSLSVS